jgi:hypothetical protein
MVAEIATLVSAESAVVETVKLAVVSPFATVTVEGTLAALVTADARLTTTPFEDAAVLIVTVPVTLLPPMIEVGLSVTLVTVTGETVRLAPLLAPPEVAVMVAVAAVFTALVEIENVALDWPAPIVTELSTVADALLLESATTSPPVGALMPIWTVPVTVPEPPSTLFDESMRLVGVNGITVKMPVAQPPAAVPVMFAVCWTLTADVDTANVAVL